MEKNQFHFLEERVPIEKASLLLIQGEHCIPMQKNRIQSRASRGKLCIIRTLLVGRISRTVTSVLANKSAQAKLHEKLNANNVVS